MVPLRYVPPAARRDGDDADRRAGAPEARSPPDPPPELERRAAPPDVPPAVEGREVVLRVEPVPVLLLEEAEEAAVRLRAVVLAALLAVFFAVGADLRVWPLTSLAEDRASLDTRLADVRASSLTSLASSRACSPRSSAELPTSLLTSVTTETA